MVSLLIFASVKISITTAVTRMVTIAMMITVAIITQRHNDNIIS